MDMILWSSQKPPMRYFWVPAGEDVFIGDYGIENNEGEQFSVDLESLIPFEISNAEAEALMMQDLENMTKELGGLFKGLFQLGKRMLDHEIMDDTEVDSDEDWDSDDDSDSDVDLDKIMALFDEEDSDFDSEESSDDVSAGSLDELIAQFGSDLEGPLTELRDIITTEVGSLGRELEEVGQEAAKALDDNPDAAQSILRELGQWLIQLAEEQEDSSEEDSSDDESAEAPTIMPFPTVPEPEFIHDEVSDDDATTEEPTPVSVTDENIQEETDTEIALDEAPLQATEIVSPELPTASALKRLNKSQLVELGETWGLSLSTSQSKKDLLAAIETLR